MKPMPRVPKASRQGAAALLLCALAAVLPAEESVPGGPLAALVPLGFVSASETPADGPRQLIIGPSGQRYEVVASAPLTGFQVQSLQDLDLLMPQLQNISFSQIQVEPRGSGLALLGLPSDLRVESTDYLEFVPAGIGGTWSVGFLPDFSVFVEGRRVRIQGTIADEAELLDAIAAAVADPAAFLRSQDPRLLSERIGELAGRVTAAEGGVSDLATEVEELQQTAASLQDADSSLSDALSELDSSLNASLALALAELQVAVRQVQTALAISRNDAFFGGLQPITDEIIDAVLAAYDSLDEPSVPAVRDLLDADGLSVGAREVEAILLAFRSFLP